MTYADTQIPASYALHENCRMSILAILSNLAVSECYNACGCSSWARRLQRRRRFSEAGRVPARPGKDARRNLPDLPGRACDAGGVAEQSLENLK